MVGGWRKKLVETWVERDIRALAIYDQYMTRGTRRSLGTRAGEAHRTRLEQLPNGDN